MNKAEKLAQKLTSAANAVNTSDRNARSMFTDAGFWSTVADAIVEAFSTEEAQVEEPVVEEVEEEEPKVVKKRGRRR